MLQFPPPLEPRSFLAEHWQRAPLFLPRGMPSMHPVIGAGDLAWLATQEDVESRLVFTDRQGRERRYRADAGPFDEHELQALPAENWTLLVHDVDKHLPEFRAYIDAAGFVPDWRIDDLMISIAAPGGSVGPHRDNYDVFLCQASGTRDWQLAAPEDAIPARHASALALLEPFDNPEPLAACPSDVLYLPPGVPHWGVARDLCITYSIGMRAPTRGELSEALSAESGKAAGPTTAADAFYVDPDLDVAESSPGMISSAALRRARELVGDRNDTGPVPLARAFGRVVTAPKSWLVPEPPDERDAASLAAGAADAGLRVHGMARLAWCRPTETVALAFVNGQAYAASTTQLDVFRTLCRERMLRPAQLAEAIDGGNDAEWFRCLIAAGAFDVCDVS